MTSDDDRMTIELAPTQEERESRRAQLLAELPKIRQGLRDGERALREAKYVLEDVHEVLVGMGVRLEAPPAQGAPTTEIAARIALRRIEDELRRLAAKYAELDAPGVAGDLETLLRGIVMLPGVVLDEDEERHR